MLNPQAGDTFVLSRTFGVGPGAVPEGTTLEVVEIVPPNTPGVGGGGQDRILLKCEHPSTVLNEEGSPTEGTSTRVLALTAEELTDLVEPDNGG